MVWFSNSEKKIVYSWHEQVGQYIEDKGSQLFHCKKRGLQTGKGRNKKEPWNVGLVLEVSG